MRTVDELAALSDAPGKLPIDMLCQDSLYYPSAKFDGSPVRIMGRRGIQSFVFVDYGVTATELSEALVQTPFAGYEIAWSREVDQAELAPAGWKPAIQPGLNDGSPPRADIRTNGFADWCVLRRLAGREDSHGPSAFSLLYIGGDGAATFQALYWNRSAPACVAIIQPGTGFGGNWTDFTAPGQILYRSVMENPAGCPELLLYGGWGDNPELYDPACWPEFDQLVGTFTPSPHGRAAKLWRRPKD